MTIQEFMLSMKRLKVALPQFAPSFDEESISIWFGYFKEFDHETFAKACAKAVATEKTFPAIATLLEMINGPKPDKKAEATEIANRIWQVIDDKGWPNEAEARAILNDVAWEIVRMQGGWVTLCQSIDEGNQKPAYIAQWRDIAVSLLDKQERGVPLAQIPGTQHKPNAALEAALNIAKGIEAPKT
jgi:hypothetical protein